MFNPLITTDGVFAVDELEVLPDSVKHGLLREKRDQHLFLSSAHVLEDDVCEACIASLRELSPLVRIEIISKVVEGLQAESQSGVTQSRQGAGHRPR